MTLILGLDIATTTGWALFSFGEPLSSTRTGVIKAKGNDSEEKAASLGLQLVAMLKTEKVQFVGIEQPMRNLVPFRKKQQTLAGEIEQTTINPNALQLSSMTGGAVSIISAFRIPWITIPSATWRKCFLGKGREKNWQRANWKRAAVEQCRFEKIDVKSADAAEAVGIAFATSRSQHFQLFIDGLSMQQYESRHG